jgi:regulator of nucleoside diphosphate kinase
MRKRFQLTLTISDFKLLLKQYYKKGMSVFNKRKLFGELRGAHIVKEDSLPLNIARQGSKILVRNITKKQTYRVHIVADNPGQVRSNRISITDPLSIALLGYGTGHRTEWEMPDGIQQFEVISVSQHTEDMETAGDTTIAREAI